MREAMRLKYSVFLALLLLLIGAIPAVGEVSLRYQWQAGDVFILNKVVEVAGTIRGGTAAPQTMSERATIRKKVTVESVDPGGRAQLRVALLLVSATKSVGEDEIQYSLSPERIVMDDIRLWRRNPNEQEISPKVGPLRQLFHPRAIECSAQGRTKNLSSPALWLEAASQSDLFHLFGIGEEGWLPLPERPLEVGDTWQDGLAAPIRSGTSQLWHDTRLRLERLEDRGGAPLAVIGFERERQIKDLQADVNPSAPHTLAPLKAYFMESRQDLTGWVEFNIEEGRPLRCEAEGQARLRYSLGGRIAPELRALVVEYDWERVRVQTEWERLRSVPSQ